MDIYSRKKRSEIMAGIGAANTAPEVMVRRTLHAMGYRFRLHKRDLPGKPDIVLSQKRTVVFVHGCFWHHHRGCRKATFPSTNAAFWRDKIEANVRRDKSVTVALKRKGWHAIVIWECETKSKLLGKRLSKALPVRTARSVPFAGREHA